MDPDVTCGCLYPWTPTLVLTLTCRRSSSVRSLLAAVSHSNVQHFFYCSLFNYSSPTAASTRVCARVRVYVLRECQAHIFCLVACRVRVTNKGLDWFFHHVWGTVGPRLTLWAHKCAAGLTCSLSKGALIFPDIQRTEQVKKTVTILRYL